MPNFADVHLKPEVLARYGLPDIAYPIASADLKSAVDAGGELPLAMMLHGLQVSTRDGGTEWKRYDSGFHHALIMGCGSAELLAVHRLVFDKYLRYQMVYLTFRGQIAADEHQALLQAALARDIGRAQAILVRHIDGGVAHALAAHAAAAAQG